MRLLGLRTAAIALAASVGLGGCAYGTLGVGAGYGGGYGSYGYGYDPYYGGGYGSYGYGSPYGAYGYGYGSPYSGWYGDFYYPGTGYYVYDRDRHQHRWSDSQRQYWMNRHQQATTHGSASSAPTSPDWRGFNRPSGSSSSTDWQARRQAWRQQHSQQTQQQHSQQTLQQSGRSEVRSDQSSSQSGHPTPRHPRNNDSPNPQ